MQASPAPVFPQPHEQRAALPGLPALPASPVGGEGMLWGRGRGRGRMLGTDEPSTRPSLPTPRLTSHCLGGPRSGDREASDLGQEATSTPPAPPASGPPSPGTPAALPPAPAALRLGGLALPGPAQHTTGRWAGGWAGRARCKALGSGRAWHILVGMARCTLAHSPPTHTLVHPHIHPRGSPGWNPNTAVPGGSSQPWGLKRALL